MHGAVIEIESPKTGEVEPAVYEHSWAVRFSHWLNAVSLLVMVASGFQIFRAFPSFGAKIPQKDLLHWPQSFALGGWLGGGLLLLRRLRHALQGPARLRAAVAEGGGGHRPVPEEASPSARS